MKHASAAALFSWQGADMGLASKAEIFAALGDLTGFKLAGTEILYGSYIRPVKTRGGIITQQDSQLEDHYQGKVGLIVKLGASIDPANPKWLDHFGGRVPEVGDWILVGTNETHQLHVRGPGATISKDRIELSGWKGDHPWPCWRGSLSAVHAIIDDPGMIV